MNINEFPELKESILKLKEKKYEEQDLVIKNALQDLTNTLDLSDDEILKRVKVLENAIRKKTMKVLKELEDECMKHLTSYSQDDSLPEIITELRFWHIPETVKMWETIYYLNDKILQETIHTKKTFWEIFGLVLNKKKSELNEILTTLVPDNQTALWEEWFDIKSINSAVLPTEKKTEKKTDNSWDAQSSWRSSTTEDFDKDLLDFFAPKNSTDGENLFPSVGPDAISREEGATNEWEEEDISKPGSAYNRIKYLKQILDEREVPFEYRLAIIWTNTPEMRREQSYAVIRIERLDRTVLINNSYGEATYVVTWILDIEDLITFTKKDYQEDQNAVRVRFFSSNPGLWGSQMSEALFSPINKKLKNHIKKQEEAELKKEEDELKTKKEAINNEKKREEITKFFLKNYGTKIEITKENEKDYTFPEKENNSLNIFTGEKNEQLYIFTEGEERNVYTFTEEDKEKLIMMTRKERSELKITVWGESQGLQATARTFWLKEGKPANNQEDRVKLLSEIIWEKIKSKKEIFKTKFIERLENKFGKNIESFTEEDKERLIIMTGEERNKAFEITVWGEPQSLDKIATAFWLKEEDPADNEEDREKLLSEIMWEKIKSKKEIFKTKFIERLENKFGKNIESFTDEDKEKLIMMTAEERNKAFEIIVWGESQSLNKIATACWVEGVPANNQKDREKFLSKIIKGGIKSKEEITDALNQEIRKETIKYFNEHYATKKIENWKVIYVFTEEDKEKLVMMEARERKDLKITVWGESQGLQATARTFWLKEGNPAKNQEDREKLLSEIIWKKIKSKKEIFKTKFIEHLESKFGENIESFIDEDKEKLIMMTKKERSDLKITVWGESQSLEKIATAFWLEKEKPAQIQEDREKLLSEIFKEGIKSKKELIKKYFTKDFLTAEEAKKKLATMTEWGRTDYKISIQGRKLGLRSMAKDFWIKGDPAKDLEVLEQLIDTIWTYEPRKEKALSSAKDSLQAHHCELNEETLLEEVSSTNTNEVAKTLE